MDSPLQYFVCLTDPRIERNREHVLEEILLIAIAEVLRYSIDPAGSKARWNQSASDGKRTTCGDLTADQVAIWYQFGVARNFLTWY